MSPALAPPPFSVLANAAPPRQRGFAAPIPPPAVLSAATDGEIKTTRQWFVAATPYVAKLRSEGEPAIG